MEPRPYQDRKRKTRDYEPSAPFPIGRGRDSATRQRFVSQNARGPSRPVYPELTIKILKLLALSVSPYMPH
jgi:hypothetical protein